MDAKTGTNSDTYDPLPAQRSPAAVKMDNLIRRTLRVSNPYDAGDVASGLTRFYRGARRAQELEEAGLPFYQVERVEVAPQQVPAGPASVELQQGLDDIGRDLNSLINNALLKDIEPELKGWQSAINGIITEAGYTARMALDPRQRDRTFAARRQINDFARIARFVGALTPGLSPDYRRLAQSLDEVANTLLVIMGDALANIGFGSGRFLLQTTASELQERREAVLSALRVLNGSTQHAYGQSDWPWGLHALRQILKRLDTSGHSDLRAMFEESHVSRVMDDLISRAAQGGVKGLRELGATAVMAVQSIRRLLQVGQMLDDPASPPFRSYLSALQLFADAFTSSSSGYRLLFIARPPISLYGLYGLGGPDLARDRLVTLVSRRNQFAELLDCYLGCRCDFESSSCQVIFDKLLYDVDRGIDYYALGSREEGEAELRASVFALIIQTLLADRLRVGFPDCFPADGTNYRIGDVLKDIVGLLAKPIPNAGRNSNETLRHAMLQEICIQEDSEKQWESLLSTMAPSCLNAADMLENIHQLLQATKNEHFMGETCPPVEVVIPPTVETGIASIRLGAGTDNSYQPSRRS